MLRHAELGRRTNGAQDRHSELWQCWNLGPSRSQNRLEVTVASGQLTTVRELTEWGFPWGCGLRRIEPAKFWNSVGTISSIIERLGDINVHVPRVEEEKEEGEKLNVDDI